MERAELKYQLNLENDVTFTFQYSPISCEQTLSYAKEMHEMKDKRNRLLTIKQVAIIDYNNGTIADEFNLTYEIINHENKGKEFYLGIDISANSHIFIDITFIRKEDHFTIKTIHKGVTCLYDIEDETDLSLMKPVNSPINIPSNIEIKYNQMEIPFAYNDGSFEIPASIRSGL